MANGVFARANSVFNQELKAIDTKVLSAWKRRQHLLPECSIRGDRTVVGIHGGKL